MEINKPLKLIKDLQTAENLNYFNVSLKATHVVRNNERLQ